jgi:hypothetical protein
MKRTTVVLPDELAERLDLERRRRDVSTASIIREAVERYFCEAQDDAFGFIGMVASGGTGLDASDDEAYLAAHWAGDIAADQGDVLTPTQSAPSDEALVKTNA